MFSFRVIITFINSTAIALGNISIRTSFGKIFTKASRIATMFPTHFSMLYSFLKLLKYSFIVISATADIAILTIVVFPNSNISATTNNSTIPDIILLTFIIFSPHLGVRQIFYFFSDILLLPLLNLLSQILANVSLGNKIPNM